MLCPVFFQEMGKPMERFDRIVGWLVWSSALIGGFGVASMMAHVTLDVVFRYALNRPLPGTLTMVTYYYMILVAFVPLGFVERQRAHISVEVFTALMPPRIAKVLGVITSILTMAVMILLAWRGADAALKAMRLGAAQVQGDSEILVWPAYFAIPLGAGLMTFVLFWRLLRWVAGQEQLS
ncbi:TRAP transporter small permease [Lutimaribacter saemankumensis]